MQSKVISLILGDQLYKNHPAFELELGGVTQKIDYVMLESIDFNSEYKYHKTRILHCFVSMREYKDYLETLNKHITYYKYDDDYNLEKLFNTLNLQGYNKLIIAQIDDKKLKKVIANLCIQNQIELEILPSPKFLTSELDWNNYKKAYPNSLKMNNFYIMQRRRLGIFVDNKGNSDFGKWSLDDENRKKIPKTESVQSRKITYESKHKNDVIELIKNEFADNYGEVNDIYFPISHLQSEELLKEFCDKYFEKFGDYEDALSDRDAFLFHSTISPLLNNGLLTPSQVLDFVMQIPKVPDNSREGFVRQIIGWREWVNCLYWQVYDEDLKTYNFWQNTNKLPSYFWDRSSLENQTIRDNLPLYNALKNVFDFGYCHHIERLMVISNWMTLNEYDPMDCFRWFMTMFIDSYEWVMVANVFGMGLYADGGIFATKPYVAGGNYLRKMSDYKVGKDEADWEKLWTDKFWYFVLKHEKVFASNPRMSMLIATKKKKIL
jgi:deoxyribodipyrimidine photolyase-related protein